MNRFSSCGKSVLFFEFAQFRLLPNFAIVCESPIIKVPSLFTIVLSFRDVKSKGKEAGTSRRSWALVIV
jgi:hypothetical protein